MEIVLAVLKVFPSTPAAITIISGPDPLAGYVTPTAINAAGAIISYFRDSTIHNEHGFLRDPSGEFTTFDHPHTTFLRSQGGYFNQPAAQAGQ